MSMDSSAGGDPMGSGDAANPDPRAFDDRASGATVSGAEVSGGAVSGGADLGNKVVGDKSVDETDAITDLDLDDDRAGLGGPDASVAALFRTGLEPDAAQTRRVIAGLPAIQDRARRSQRRRQALAVSTAALAVAASAVLVSGLPGTPRASVVTPAGASTGTSSSTTSSNTSVTDPSPTASTPTDGTPSPLRVGPASLLTVRSLTVFWAVPEAGENTGSDTGAGQVIEESAPEDIAGQPVITGICVDSAVPGPSPVRGWQGSWRMAELPAQAIVPPGLIEKIWQWDDAESGPALLDRLEKELATCSAKPGLEGRGVTTSFDVGKQISADRVLASAASDGQGNQAVQVVALVKGVVIQVDAVVPEKVKLTKGSKKEINEKQGKLAIWSVTSTVQAAIERVVGS